MDQPLTNRSMPPGTVTSVLGYEDVSKAVEWLCRAFGLSERLRIGTHRAQLLFGDGAIVVTQWQAGANVANPSPHAPFGGHSVMVRVADVDQHYKHARAQGAHILEAPASYPFGERQYTAVDLGGHIWTFSQSISDVDPVEWGGTVIESEL